MLSLDAVGEDIAEFAVGIEQLKVFQCCLCIFLRRIGTDRKHRALLGAFGDIRPVIDRCLDLEAQSAGLE